MADIIDIDVFQTITSVIFEVEPNTNIININKVTSSSGGGATNLSTTQTASNFTINSDTGDDALVPLGNGTLAGASLNNYTTAEQTKLAGIATGAEVNVNADWNAVSGDAQILNKPTIPSISGLATVTYVDTQDALKVDKVVGKELSTNDYTTAEKNKLAAITGTNTGDQNLQEVVTKGNTITVPTTKDKGIDITLSNNSTLYQNGIVVTVPQQTGEFPTYNPAPDAFVAILNGQNPGTLTGSPVGFLADITGNDNYGFIADLRTGASNSVGCDMRSFDSHTGNFYVGAKYISNVRSEVFKVNNFGELTAQKIIKNGGTSSEILAADGSVITAGTNITITGGQISSVGGAGGGSSVNYYLNGGTSQGTFGGTTYYEFSKTAVIGTGADFSRGSNGLIASFITDVADPSLLLIPAGNWNLEFFFSSSSAGGSPSFYVELYKYDGTTFTLITSSSATPEGITGGTSIDAYFTALAVPETVLTVNDRLAIRVFVNASSKTITLHTQDSHLCEVITTFTAGLTALNGLQAQVQNFATGTTGTDFAINSSGSTHTFNLPSASATARGVITTTTQTFAGDKTFTGTIGAGNLSGTNTGDNATNTQYSGLATSKQDVITLTTTGTSGASTLVGATLNIPQYSGATNLGYTAAPTNGTVTSSTGTSATISLADATNAGLLKPAKFTVLENTSGTNTGDQNLSGYALLASPTFTGTPSLPTGTTGTTQTPLNNSTRLATTAYVEAAIAVVSGTQGVQVSSQDTFGTTNIATLTAAQYAALGASISATTLYFITA